MPLKSIRNLEGVLLLDHRDSPGVPPEVLKAAGLPTEASRGLHEYPVYTCGHCQAQVVKHPERVRERAFCRKCQHVICDGCAAILAQTLTCRPFEQWADEVLEAAEKAARSENGSLLVRD